MRNILIISDQGAISGGAAKVALTSAAGLARRGHRVTVFVAAGPVWEGLEAAGAEVICLEQHALLHHANPIQAALQGIWNRSAAEALAALLEYHSSPDTVVHLHAWSKALSPSIGPILCGSGLPVVATLHEYFLACPNGGFYNYRRQAHCPLRPMSLACMTRNCDSRTFAHKGWRVTRQAMLRAFGAMGRKLRHFIYLSETQRQVIAPYLPTGATLHHVGNPVDVVPCEPADVSGNTDFLCVGRLSPEKGIDLFAEAVARTGAHGRLVGDGPLRGELACRHPQIDVTGWLAPAKVLQEMRSARALVFPSRWYECQPLTTLEALANGVPVIVSDASAALEQIRPGLTGLVFPSGDVAALAARMHELSSAEFAARLGRNAHARYWTDPLTLDRHLDRLEVVYDHLAYEARC